MRCGLIRFLTLPLSIFLPIIVLVSAAIAYALVYGIPNATGYDVYDYIDTFTPRKGRWVTDSIDVYPDIVDLAKLQPEEYQEVIKGLFDQLKRLSEAQLYMLSAANDVCKSTLIICNEGIPSEIVKPFVEKVLALKQAEQNTAISAGSLETARLSLAVAFAAFIVSIFGLFVKKKS
jgi:hypothetical protein